MQKNELLKKDGSFVRILAAEGDEVRYIPCRGTCGHMPEWCRVSEFEGYKPCSEEELQAASGVELVPEDGLEPSMRNAARQRFAIIAPVLGCLEDEKIRAQMIERTAKEHGVTKQTVRNYLKMYLAYHSLSALAPKHRKAKEKPLTEDEKNIRWQSINMCTAGRKTA